MMFNKDAPLRNQIEKTHKASKQTRLFTQEEVDNIIKKRLARAKQDSDQEEVQEETAEDVQEEVQEAQEEPVSEEVEVVQDDSQNERITALEAENESLRVELKERQDLQDLIDYAEILMKQNSVIPELAKYPKEVYQPLIDYTSRETVEKSVDAILDFITWTVEAGKAGDVFDPSAMGLSVDSLIKDAFKRPESR